MSKAMIEALKVQVDALEKSDKSTSMRVDALEKAMAAHFTNSNVKQAPVDAKVSTSKPKKEKKEKKPKPGPDDKPKATRVTGYILFGKNKRDDVVVQLSVSDEKPKNTEVMTEIARQWRALSDSEKDEWNAAAKKIKDAKDVPHVELDDEPEDDDDDDDDN